MAGFTGVRFSLAGGETEGLYDGIDGLGLNVEKDDLSVCLIGEEPRLFEGIRVIFGRASSRGGSVLLTATFSAGCPGEPNGPPCIPRTLSPDQQSSDLSEEGWISEAYSLPTMVHCQFALYPLGAPNYMNIIYDEITAAKEGTVYETGKHFCSCLKGSGVDVFDQLRKSFQNARKGAAHVVMTCVMKTADKS